MAGDLTTVNTERMPVSNVEVAISILQGTLRIAFVSTVSLTDPPENQHAVLTHNYTGI